VMPSEHAFFVVNEYIHGGIYQGITPPQVSGANLVLDVWAKVVDNAGRTGISKVEAYTHWDFATGDAAITASLGFTGPDVYFYVWDGYAQGGVVYVPAPTDGAFHHYVLLLPGLGKEVEPTVPGGVGLGLLTIDGLPQLLDVNGAPAIARGTPATVDPATLIYVGEGNWCDCAGGAAPDVVFDELYFGVQV